MEPVEGQDGQEAQQEVEPAVEQPAEEPAATENAEVASEGMRFD